MPIHEGGAFPECAERPDVLIAGAGAVGIAMAVSLARAGLYVTVLEAGPANPASDYRLRNAGPSSGRPHKGLVEGRMKALGGTTRLWGGQLVPFDEHDFASVDESGKKLWPISYAEFSEAIDKAYELLGIGKEARDTKELWQRATGAALTPAKGLAFHMNLWLPEPQFHKLFAHDLAHLDNLHVITDAPVTDLEFGEDGKVSGLRVALGEGDQRLFRASEYVLASGTIEIVRLLLSSAATARGCPYADNRHIGRWFMDHLHGIAGTITGLDEARLRDLFDNVYFDGRKYTVKIRRRSECSNGANVVATINSRISVGDFIRESFGLGLRMFSGHSGFLSALKNGVALGSIMVPLAWRYLVRRRSTSVFARGAQLGIEVEQKPNAQSYLYLDPDADPASAAAGVHWAIDGDEIGAAADIASRVQGWFEDQGLGKVELDPRLEARDPGLLDEFHDVSHHMGGARMADDPASGVVDSECRVFGAPNLTIGGAAVFPTGSFANPTLSAIALGLRSAERIAAQLDHRGQSRIIPRLVFGCGRLTGGASEATALKLLDHVFAAGVQAVDCAPTYGIGTAEVVVGKALRRARNSGRKIHVIAKVGSARPRHGLLKTYLRAAKRLVKAPKLRTRDDFEPIAPCESFGRGQFSAEDLRASFEIARGRLGPIDELLVHDCAPGDFGEEQKAALSDCANSVGARYGYAISSYFDPTCHSRYPDDCSAECAVPPDLMAGEWTGEIPDGTILHSIVPTCEWLTRSSPAFAAGVARAMTLLPNSDPDTARVAVFHALAAARALNARIVFASSVERRLAALLQAFAEIDRRNLLGPISVCFDGDVHEKEEFPDKHHASAE